MSTLAVNVDPDLSFVLPAGTISERVTRSFQQLNIDFAVSYTLLDSDTSGSILFRYPVWILEPQIQFAYSLDFEQTVFPSLANGELELIAGDKYLSRLKEVDLGTRCHSSVQLVYRDTLENPAHADSSNVALIQDSLHLAQAVDPALSAVVYLETSLFSLREKM